MHCSRDREASFYELDSSPMHKNKGPNLLNKALGRNRFFARRVEFRIDLASFLCFVGFKMNHTCARVGCIYVLLPSMDRESQSRLVKATGRIQSVYVARPWQNPLVAIRFIMIRVYII